MSEPWEKRWRLAAALPIALTALAASACTSELGGRASFPLVSRATLPGEFEKVADVDEQRCMRTVLFFFAWGEDSNHEALVTELLQKYDGDAIINADLTFTFVPALIYTQDCANITGTVVRRGRGTVARSVPARASEGEEP